MILRLKWAALCAAAAAAAPGWASAQGEAAVVLPPEIAQVLARADVPASAVAMVVAPLPPPPGTVSRVPEPVNPSGERNPAPAPQTLPAPRLEIGRAHV